MAGAHPTERAPLVPVAQLPRLEPLRMVWVAICLGPDYLKMAGPSHSNLFVVETQETQNHPTALLWGSHLLGFPQRRVRVASVLLSAGGAVRAHRHHPHPPNVQFVRPPPQPSVRLRKMQYSHPQVESEWRTQFHSRQLSSDTLFSTAGLAYGAATTSKLFATLPAGAAAPHLTVALLALSQYVVLGMIVGTLLARNWYAWARPRLVWTLPIFFGCSSSHWSAVVYQQEIPSASPWWNFLKLWCIRGRWLMLALLAYGIRQPLDDHMTTQFPGVLAALGFNNMVCSDIVTVPDFRRCFHAVYCLWRFILAPGTDTLQHLLYPNEAPSAAGFTEGHASLVCQGTFAASQLLLAFVWPCLWVLHWEWRDRIANLTRPELRGRRISIQFTRMYDVAAIMLLEVAIFFLLFD